MGTRCADHVTPLYPQKLAKRGQHPQNIPFTGKQHCGSVLHMKCALRGRISSTYLFLFLKMDCYHFTYHTGAISCKIRYTSLNVAQNWQLAPFFFLQKRDHQGRIKLFGAPRQWKYFRPLFQAVFLSGGVLHLRQSNTTPPSPQTVKHHASQSQDRNNKYFILYIEFCVNNKI